MATRTMRGGEDPLGRVKGTEAVAWLAASPELVASARDSCRLLFDLALPYLPPSQCPLRELLTDPSFDTEQVWQQIDLQARPLLSSLPKRLRFAEKNATQCHPFFLLGLENASSPSTALGSESALPTQHGDEVGNEDEDEDENEDEDEDGEDEDGDKDGSEEDGEDESEDGDGDGDEEDGSIDGNIDGNIGGSVDGSGSEDEEEGGGLGTRPGKDRQPGKSRTPKKVNIEDAFLDLKDMERFLDQAEEEDIDEDATGNKGGEGLDTESDEEMDADHDRTRSRKNKKIMYKDFFNNIGKQHEIVDAEDDDEMSDSDSEKGFESLPVQPKNLEGENLSAHEKQLEKINKRIDQLEKANLETKSWAMQGEITAAKRPRNSALEVELDFEHNSRPPPVITEEMTTSLEEMIRNRIIEERFDDVQRKAPLPSTKPREKIELDESKSKRGLGEIYEDEYMQATGHLPASVSASDALKNEARMLYKSLLVRLDALSHFHFAPKPVIEDMAVRTSVPALAMEEVAPMAVSDANMLAPEEVFAGEQSLKADNELSREERKRLRAKKKKKSKAERVKKESLKRPLTVSGLEQGKELLPFNAKKQRVQQSHYGKSSKVFAELDKQKELKEKAKDLEVKALSQKRIDTPAASFLKL